MSRHTSALVALLIITLIATLISGSIASVIDVTRIQEITKKAYNYKDEKLNNPQRYYEQQDLAQLLGATGITSQSKSVCQEIQLGLDNIYSNRLNMDNLNQMLAYSRLISLYSCANISITTQTTDVLDALVLSDSLNDIYIGVSLFKALLDQKTVHIDANRYDWVDIFDLIQSLHLIDGLTRSTVSTLSPSVHNTVIALDIISKAIDIMPASQREGKTEEINKSFEVTLTAIKKIAGGMCNRNSNIILSAIEYSDFFTAYSIFHKALPTTTEALEVPIQCIVAQTQTSLQSNQFGAVYNAIKFLKTLEEIKQSPIYNFTDRLTATSALFIIQTPSNVVVKKANGDDMMINAVAFEISSFLKFTPVNSQIFTKSTQPIAVTITPQTVLTQATVKPTAEATKVQLASLFSDTGVKMISSNDIKSIYGAYTISISLNNTSSPFYTSPIFISGTDIKKVNKISVEQLKVEKNAIPSLIIDGKSSTKQQLTGVTTKALNIDFSTQLQVEVTIAHDKNILSSLRLVACPPTAKDCLKSPQSTLDAINSDTLITTSFFAPSKVTKNAVAPLYFTSPMVKSLILAQKHKNPSFLIILDQVNLTTRDNTSVYLGGFTSSISNQQIFDDFYITNDNSAVVAQAQKLTSPNASASQKRSYLWDIIEPHYHTFAGPARTGNPFFATVFISIIIGATALFVITFLFKFKPTPNLSSAFGSINFLLFTVSLGAVLCALMIYWLKMTLFQAMMPAALMVLPVTFAIGIPLRESVGSLRLYNLLYVEQATQPTDNKKKD